MRKSYPTIGLTIICLVSFNVYAKPFNCESPPDDIMSVYKKGVKDKIGHYGQSATDEWARKYTNDFDREILTRVWRGTDEWSKIDSERMAALSFNANNISEIGYNYPRISTAIERRCGSSSGYSICEVEYADGAECIAFYNNRYSKLIEHYDNEIKAAQRKFQPAYNNILQNARKDFGVIPENTILAYQLFQDPTYHPDVPIYGYYLEQANFRIESLKSDKSSKIESNSFKSSVYKNLNHANIIYSVNKNNIKYGTDKKSLHFEIVREGTYDLEQLGRFGPSKAGYKKNYKPVKVILYGTPKELKAVFKQLKKNGYSYSPILAYEIEESRVALKGAYLADLIREGSRNMGIRKLDVIESSETKGYLFGAESASAFETLLEGKEDERAIRSAQRRAVFCSRLRLVAESKSPLVADSLLRFNGCL